MKKTKKNKIITQAPLYVAKKDRKYLSKLNIERKLLEAVDLWVKGSSARTISKIINVPKSTIQDWLSSNDGIGLVKKRGLDLIDASLVPSIMKDLKQQEKTRPSASHEVLTISLGTKIDKLRPPYAGVHVGDRNVSVEFSGWKDNPFIPHNVEEGKIISHKGKHKQG